MKETNRPDIIINNSQERPTTAWRRELPPDTPTGIKRLNIASLALQKAKEKWLEVIKNSEGVTWSEIIYRGNVGPYLDYLARTKDFSLALGKAERFKHLDQRIAKAIGSDVFCKQIRGLSLADIEKMPLPLSLGDLGRVGRFLWCFPPLLPLLTPPNKKSLGSGSFSAVFGYCPA